MWNEKRIKTRHFEHLEHTRTHLSPCAVGVTDTKSERVDFHICSASNVFQFRHHRVEFR